MVSYRKDSCLYSKKGNKLGRNKEIGHGTLLCMLMCMQRARTVVSCNQEIDSTETLTRLCKESTFCLTRTRAGAFIISLLV